MVIECSKSTENRGCVIVIGATSLIGRFLLPRLETAGYAVTAVSRKPSAAAANHGPNGRVSWHRIEHKLNDCVPPLPERADQLVHLAPLWSLPKRIPEFAAMGGKQVIAFSSTSRFTKTQSPDTRERDLAQRLNAAELEVSEICERCALTWILFRPTLIYGARMDKNVSTIARFIARFGFFPVAGAGTGLRQPIHADDLARLCIEALHHPNACNKVYNVGGAETFQYSTMVELIFDALGMKPRIPHIPIFAYRLLIAVARLRPAYRHVTNAMLERMNQDLNLALPSRQSKAREKLATGRLDDLEFVPVRRFVEAIRDMMKDKAP